MRLAIGGALIGIGARAPLMRAMGDAPRGPRGEKGVVRPRPRPSFGPVADDGDVVGPRPRWNADRAAYDVVLPHGKSWTSTQIEWFVGTWWKHLAEASVATFAESLAHFSAWASDEHGLESLIAWLGHTASTRADLVALQEIAE